MNNIEIPSESDWGEYWKDLDQKSAYENFYGKSNEQLQNIYYSRGQEIMTEIRFMPSVPLKYYLVGFKDFVTGGRFPEYESSDYASYFLDMIEALLFERSEDIASLKDELVSAAKYISENQDSYEADKSIYGDFADNYERILAKSRG